MDARTYNALLTALGGFRAQERQAALRVLGFKPDADPSVVPRAPLTPGSTAPPTPAPPVVAALVSGGYSAPRFSVPPSVLAGAGLPDRWCYLDLFRDPERERIGSALGPNPLNAFIFAAAFSDPSPLDHAARYRLTFGPPASAHTSQKWLAHLTRVPLGASLLTARDVLSLLPVDGRLGQEESVPPPFAPSARAAGPSLLGELSDPLVRRFYVHVGSLEAGAAGAYYLNSFDLTPGPIATWLGNFQYARWVSLRVHVVPLAGAYDRNVVLDAAFFPHGSPAPAGSADYDANPTRQRRVYAPGQAMGSAGHFAIEFGASPGLTPQVKPVGLLGYAPALALRFKSAAVTDADLDPAQELLSVEVEGVLSAHYP